MVVKVVKVVAVVASMHPHTTGQNARAIGSEHVAATVAESSALGQN